MSCVLHIKSVTSSKQSLILEAPVILHLIKQTFQAGCDSFIFFFHGGMLFKSCHWGGSDKVAVGWLHQKAFTISDTPQWCTKGAVVKRNNLQDTVGERWAWCFVWQWLAGRKVKYVNPQHRECQLHLLVLREASMETFQMEALGSMIHQPVGQSGFRRAVRNKETPAPGMNCYTFL